MSDNIEKDVIDATDTEVELACEIFERPKYEVVKRDGVFALLLLAASVITSAFGIFAGFKAGFTVSLILLLFSVTAYLLPAREKIKPFPFLCMLLGIAVSLSFSFTTNGAVRFWSFVSVVVLYSVWFVSLSSPLSENGDLDIIGKIFSPVFAGGLGEMPKAMRSLFSGDKEKTNSLLKVISGAALAVPVLFVVVPLLASADGAFSGMLELLFGDLISGFLKVLLGIAIAVFVISYGLFLKKYEEKPIEATALGSRAEDTIVISFLSVISICYLAYLFSQLAYFFSAFSGFLPEGYKFTLSSYARRGFFEMTIIAAINFGLIFLIMLLSRKGDGKSVMPIRILGSFIGVFTLIIIATALSKMVLYISEYGMSRLRIQTSAFMLFLLVVFISLILRLYFPKVRVIRTAIIASAVVLTVLGTVNINSIVAKYNYEAYRNNKLENIDVNAIYELGDEGIPYLVKLLKEDDYSVSEEAQSYLFDIISTLEHRVVAVKNKDGGYNLIYKGKRELSLGEQTLPRAAAERAIAEFVKENRYDIIEVLK